MGFLHFNGPVKRRDHQREKLRDTQQMTSLNQLTNSWQGTAHFAFKPETGRHGQVI